MSSRLLIRNTNNKQYNDKYYDVIINSTDTDLMIMIKYDAYSHLPPPYRCWTRDMETYHRWSEYINNDFVYPGIDLFWTIDFKDGAEVVNLKTNEMIFGMIKKICNMKGGV